MAHETRVVVPGMSRFLIADIKEFGLLLSGELAQYQDSVLSKEAMSCPMICETSLHPC